MDNEKKNRAIEDDIALDAEIKIKKPNGSFTRIHPYTKEENILAPEGKKPLRETKFDDVETYIDEDAEQNVMNFYADGKMVKSVTFTAGGGLKGGTISTTLPERFTIKENEIVIIPYSFDTPNRGKATLYVNVTCGEKFKELEFPLERVGAGSVNIGAVDKGINEISIYAVDFMGQLTNVVTFHIVCGALEIHSTFDDNQDFNSYSPISIPFNVSSLDANETKVLTVNIDGQEYTKDASEGYNTFNYPEDKKTVGIHHVTIQVSTKDFKSNILEYDVIVVDSSQILISSKDKVLNIEEGTDVKIVYRISTIGNNMFNVVYTLNSEEYSRVEGKLGTNIFTAPYSEFPKGVHTLVIRASTLDGNIVGELSCTINVTESSFKRIDFVRPGLQAYFNMSKKTNQDEDKDFLLSDVISDTGKRYKLQLHDYNYATNGWIDGRLVNNGISWAEIEDFMPLESNVESGFTFDIQFESSNTGDDDAIVVDCTGNDTPYKGFKINSAQAILTTESNQLKTYYTDRTNMRVTFVVNRNSTYVDRFDGVRKPNPMVQTYINGMFTDVAMLSDTGSGSNKVFESIQNNNSILINTDRAHKLFGTNKIKSILVYNRALEHEEVLQNLMADIDNLADQKRKYDKNYVTINQDVPTMYFNDTEIGTHANMSKKNKQWINVVFVSPNKELYGPSFDLVCKTAWQGASSLQYPIKNYTIETYDYVRDDQGNIVEEFKNRPETYIKQKINPFGDGPGDGLPESTFCLKADYMDSAHARNTGTARLVNDLLFDGHPNPAKQKDPRTRDAINGFPIQLYVNNQWMGIYNLNNDFANGATLGVETLPQTVRWEIKANSDSSAGAFKVTWRDGDKDDIFEKIEDDFGIAYNWDIYNANSGEYDVTKYYDALHIHHDEETVIGGFRDYAVLSLARLVYFVGTTEDRDTFREHAHEYFDIKQACRYYLNVLVLGMIDNFAKNCMLQMYGNDGIYWFSFYDLDSSLGLDNSGYNKFETDIEPHHPNVYNCASSKMWTKLDQFLGDHISTEFKLIREGNYTYENVINYLVTTQIDIIPEIIYNKDMYTKYISQGRQYLHMLHGNNKDHLLRWIYNRFLYVDSLYLQYNSPYTKHSITIRANKPLTIPEEDPFVARFEIETYCPQYVTIAWRNNTYETKRVGFNERVVFERQMVNSTDNEILIYCAGNLKNIGDLTGLRPTSLLIGEAPRLIELKCQNSNVLVKADVSKNDYLRTIDFHGCTALGTASGGSNILDVSKCTNLRKIDVRGTQITAILSNVDGGNLEEILYSDKTQSIVLSRQTNMRKVGIPYGYNNMWAGTGAVVKSNTMLTYEQESDTFRLTPGIPDAYTVLIENKNGEVNKDSLWECQEGEYEMLFPTYGSLVKIFFFDASKRFINKVEVNDSSYHSGQEINKFTTPKGSKYAIATVSLARPMTTNNNVMYLGIVKAGDRTFRDLKDLANVQISNCKFVETLTAYSGFGKLSNIFEPMKWTQSLTLDNSLNMTEMNFGGFKKLRNLVIKNMLAMQSLGFDDMMDNETPATLYSVEIVNCPLITRLTMNVSDENHSIRFAEGGKMDISALTSIDTIETNYSIKGLKTIIMPVQLKHLIFKSEYGDGVCSIENLFSTDSVADHAADGFEGADFKNMTIETINMEGLTAVKGGLNFNIKPIEQAPNMNLNRTGSSGRPWFRPQGTVDLTEYVSDMQGMFRGCDMTKLNVIINQPSMSQTNLKDVFSDTIMSNISQANTVLSKFTKATNLTNLMTNAQPIDSIDGIQLPSTVKQLTSAFKNMKKLTADIQIPQSCIDVTEAFAECRAITNIHDNWNSESLAHGLKHEKCYLNCVSIDTIGEEPGTLNEVPREWGGYGFDEEVTMLVEFNTSLAGSKNVRIYDSEVNTVHFYTDWGDGNIDDKFSHVYAREGIYNIRTQRVSTGSDIFSSVFRKGIVRVSQMPNRLTNYYNKFKDCVNLVEARFKINPRTNVIYGLFDGCRKLEIADFDLPTGAPSMQYMMRNCNALTEITKASTWDTSNITDMSYAFYGCHALPSLACGNWNTAKVNTFRSIFQDCRALKSLPVNNWNLTAANTISNFFSGCESLTEVDVSGWNTTNVYEMNNLFQSCSKLKSVNLNNFDLTNTKTVQFMFQNCNELTSVQINEWDVRGVSSMMCLFQNCYSLTDFDLSGWQTDSLTNISYMFAGMSAVSTIDISSLNLSKVSNLNGIFSYCSMLQTIRMPNMSNAPLKNISGAFQGCYQLTNVDVSSWNTSAVSNMAGMFQECGAIVTVDVSNWNTDNCNTMISFFQNCYNLTTVKLGKWTTPLLQDSSYMFSGCSKLLTVDLSTWKTDNLVNIAGMFNACNSINSLDIKHFNVSRCKDFTMLFDSCYDLQSIDLTGWNTSAVENMSNLFSNCRSMTSLKLTGWNTAKVTTFNSAFSGMSNLPVLDLSSFDLYKADGVDALSGMFSGTNKLSNLTSPKRINNNLTIPTQSSKENLVAIINNLEDRSSNTSLKLTVGKENLALLTPSDILIATNKNWSVV